MQINKKTDLRKHYLTLRKSLSQESRKLLDPILFSNSATLPQFKNADTILFYYPINGEPNIIPLAKYAMQIGKRIAFPVSHKEEHLLSFHIVSELSELKRGAYGIPEPSQDAEKITEFTNSLCFVPALAYSRTGQRLGYGGGYYDRFLSQYNGISVGLAYSPFVTDTLPVESHDVAVNLIISEKGAFFSYE